MMLRFSQCHFFVSQSYIHFLNFPYFVLQIPTFLQFKERSPLALRPLQEENWCPAPTMKKTHPRLPTFCSTFVSLYHSAMIKFSSNLYDPHISVRNLSIGLLLFIGILTIDGGCAYLTFSVTHVLCLWHVSVMCDDNLPPFLLQSDLSQQNVVTRTGTTAVAKTLKSPNMSHMSTCQSSNSTFCWLCPK